MRRGGLQHDAIRRNRLIALIAKADPLLRHAL
jgi:hypothetical protein